MNYRLGAMARTHPLKFTHMCVCRRICFVDILFIIRGHLDIQTHLRESRLEEREWGPTNLGTACFKRAHQVFFGNRRPAHIDRTDGPVGRGFDPVN